MKELCELIIKLCNAYISCVDVSVIERTKMQKFKGKYQMILDEMLCDHEECDTVE